MKNFILLNAMWVSAVKRQNFMLILNHWKSCKKLMQKKLAAKTHDKKMEFSAYNFFCVNFFQFFSTDSNSA
jgi:hypothetical protein